MLETPVAFFIFNRPDLTARVFEAIAQQQPQRLLVVADGPRNEAERELCERARAVIQVDWDCELEMNYADENLGCKKRVSSGLDWVFSRAEAAIILEDDCLPSPDFFGFCAEMLERYRDDERVMHINGTSFVPLTDANVDYGFSKYVHVWGWASWSRAWKHYDVTAARWPAEKRRILAACADAQERRYWDQSFGAVFRGQLDTWDYQWSLACLLESGLAVVPRVNLISNLGFRADATHTKTTSIMADKAAQSLSVRNHPASVERDEIADASERTFAMPTQPSWRFYVSRVARFVRRTTGMKGSNR